MSGYIQNLRELVGTRPLVMAAAGAFIINDKGQILLQQRTDNNKWGLPGGALEPGEKVEETAKREALEETGLTINNLKLFGVYSGEELHYTYPNGDEVYIVTTIFYTRDYAGRLRLDNSESKELVFFDLSDIPVGEINPPDRPVIRDLIDKYESLK